MLLSFLRPFDISAFNILSYGYCLHPIDTDYVHGDDVVLKPEELVYFLKCLKKVFVSLK